MWHVRRSCRKIKIPPERSEEGGAPAVPAAMPRSRAGRMSSAHTNHRTHGAAHEPEPERDSVNKKKKIQALW